MAGEDVAKEKRTCNSGPGAVFLPFVTAGVGPGRLWKLVFLSLSLGEAIEDFTWRSCIFQDGSLSVSVDVSVCISLLCTSVERRMRLRLMMTS